MTAVEPGPEATPRPAQLPAMSPRRRRSEAATSRASASSSPTRPRHLSTIIHGEIELAKLELRSTVKNAGAGVGMFAGAAVLLVFSLTFGAVALAEGSPRWASTAGSRYLIVFVLLLIIVGAARAARHPEGQAGQGAASGRSTPSKETVALLEDSRAVAREWASARCPGRRTVRSSSSTGRGRTGRSRANGIALHVAEIGTGPLVLLLHGFPQFWWAWHQQLIDLADAGYRAVAVDLRGYGASDKPPRGYDAPTLAADMAALVTSLGESRRDGRRQRPRRPAGLDDGRHAIRGSCAACVVLGAAHPLRLRPRIGRDRGQRRASAYALRTFQMPRRPEDLLARDSPWVRDAVRHAGPGPRWRGTPGYVGRRRALRPGDAHPPRRRSAPRSTSAGWSARCRARRPALTPSRCARQVTAPVLHLHGDFDSCVLPTHRAGLRAVRDRRVRVAGARRGRALPAQRGAGARQRRADPLGEGYRLTRHGVSAPVCSHRCRRAPWPSGPARSRRDLGCGQHVAGVRRVAAPSRTPCRAPCRRSPAAGRRSCRCARATRIE